MVRATNRITTKEERTYVLTSSEVRAAITNWIVQVFHLPAQAEDNETWHCEFIRDCVYDSFSAVVTRITERKVDGVPYKEFSAEETIDASSG